MQRPIYRLSMKKPEETSVKLTGMRKRAKSIVLLSALVLAVCIAPVLGQQPAGKDLRAFYQQNCVSCHGPDGSAVNAEGKKLRGQDFTNPDWQSKTKDDEMVKTILKGKFFGLAMPGFKGTLTEEEAQRMVTDIIRKSQKGQVIAPDAEKPGGMKE